MNLERMTQPLRFTREHLTRPPTGGIDVVTTLQHFALITYRVEPDALRPLVHERFDLELIEAPDGQKKALISVVPFLDLDFRFVKFPWWKWRFGQTNYRAYIRDRVTGEHSVWFFGTSLDSITNNLPRHIWKLPWHRGRIRFDCRYDESAGRYTRYRMATQSDWAPAKVSLKDTGRPFTCPSGFDDDESGMVILTHPLRGYFYRRDGALGTYHIWHDRLHPTEGAATRLEFPLLDKLGLVKPGDLSNVHSVMIQHRTEFTIYPPPRRVGGGL